MRDMAMFTKNTTGLRLTPEDRKLVKLFNKKLGVGLTQIVRLGLRALATKEGVTETEEHKADEANLVTDGHHGRKPRCSEARTAKEGILSDRRKRL
jgi:hypothetical protein